MVTAGALVAVLAALPLAMVVNRDSDAESVLRAPQDGSAFYLPMIASGLVAVGTLFRLRTPGPARPFFAAAGAAT